MDPILGEIMRIKTGEHVRPDVMRRWQNYIRDELNPRIEALQQFHDEHAMKASRRKRTGGIDAG